MKKLLLASFAMVVGGGSSFALTLGSFDFNPYQMGDSLIESDGGTFRAVNYLNMVPGDPGNPGALTGANFDTGIANIGYGSTPIYTIGYNNPILDLAGDDFGIVVARYSEDDVQVELYDGSAWTQAYILPFQSAYATGEHRNYYYNGYGQTDSELFVHALNLSDLGISQVQAARITVGPNSGQLDLVRAGGLNPVPEPATMLVVGLGLAALARRRR